MGVVYNASNRQDIKRQPHDNMAQTKQYPQEIFANKISIINAIGKTLMAKIMYISGDTVLVKPY